VVRVGNTPVRHPDNVSKETDHVDQIMTDTDTITVTLFLFFTLLFGAQHFHSPLNFFSALSTISVIPMTASSSSVLPISCRPTGVPGNSSGVYSM